MTAAYLIGRALGRETSGLNALGTALLVLLALNPRVLVDPGFQMTALVILAVAGLAVPFAERTLKPWETVAAPARSCRARRLASTPPGPVPRPPPHVLSSSRPISSANPSSPSPCGACALCSPPGKR